MESGAAEGGNAGGRRAAGGGGAPERKRSKAKEVTVSLGRSIDEVHSSKLNRYCLGPKKPIDWEDTDLSLLNGIDQTDPRDRVRELQLLRLRPAKLFSPWSLLVAFSFLWTTWSKDSESIHKGSLKATLTKELELIGLVSALLATIYANFIITVPDDIEGHHHGIYALLWGAGALILLVSTLLCILYSLLVNSCSDLETVGELLERMGMLRLLPCASLLFGIFLGSGGFCHFLWMTNLQRWALGIISFFGALFSIVFYLYMYLIQILYTCVFAEKLKYTNEVVSLSAATIAKELKTYCDQTGAENIHPEVFLRRLAVTKDDDGNALQYNTLSHISRKRAVLIFDGVANQLIGIKPSEAAMMMMTAKGVTSDPAKNTASEAIVPEQRKLKRRTSGGAAETKS